MKIYEFHSCLPPELVFAVLDGQAKQIKYPNMSSCFMGTEQILYKRDGEFLWLTYTGTFPASGFIPFSGTVRVEGTGSIISGGFFFWQALWKNMLIFAAVVLLAGLIFEIPLPMLLVFVPVGVLWCFGITAMLQPLFFWKRRKAVLEFIEQHLLE